MTKRRNVSKGDGPHPVDLHVGKKLREQRVLKGLSQEHMGEAVGLTFQQIQKYEKGANRISASMLHELAKAMKVPLTVFFAGLEPVDGDAEAVELSRLNLELVRHFNAIGSEELRDRIFRLTKACHAAVKGPKPERA